MESAVQTIYLMNVNQNFKNQIWAAQNGIGARVQLENELLNRDYGINSKFGDLLISALLVDTIPEKVDTILNYVLQTGTLAERITTTPVFISNKRYTDATNNLNQINALNETGDSYIEDFIELQNFFIQLAQTPDSLRDSLIISNNNWLFAIANDSANFCQSDAVSLLESAYDTLFPVNVYVGSSSTAKKLAYSSEYFEDYECGLQIHPNPASKYLNISINQSDDYNDTEIKLYDNTGKLIQSHEILSNHLTIDLKNQKTGVYYLILLNKSSVVCSKKLVIE
ncbi:MAG: T9SS type A sorting domain-containing protein [Bacteroidales bacterium]|nr:T9SS type A sorting domain-containing protein [Bacteroidales bacterium]